MTVITRPPASSEVEGWAAMDEIEQLVDQSRQDRIDTARRATEAREKLQAAERELTTLRRAYVDTWDKATAAGWTARELRALRLPEPPPEYRPKPRRRRSRTDVDE